MAKMSGKNIWVIKVAEPTPIDGDDTKLFRSGILSMKLANAGHTVIWWDSTVYHKKKIHRFLKNTRLRINSNLEIQFLHSILYKKNADLRRIIHQYSIAKSFKKFAPEQQRPDLIVCCLAPLELSLEAVKFASLHKIPIIIDVQDIWPDSFMKFAPPWLKKPWRMMLTPFYRMVTKTCAKATAITGTTDEFIDWALSHSKRHKSSLDVAFPLAQPEKSPDERAVLEADKKWISHGIGNSNNEFIACFFGILGRHYEMDVVIKAARKLNYTRRKIKFVLCGTSDNLEKYIKMAEGCTNIYFPGWVGEAEIYSLMKMSSVGLAPYKTSITLVKNLTNKPIQYMSAGLPIISSLEGVLENILSQYKCGVTYSHGDIDALVNILTDLHDNPQQIGTMSINALSLFKNKYSAEKVYSEMVEYIEKIYETCKKIL